ncbi:hypothetical protein SAMN04488128_102422 [Chitinophaga eiseniae]|uniref:Tetratricopeptide repeat-containing protein n=1 Tax=Chitinophaga eiseniae TaxID=634771 RepID=A0A1T4QKE8_9BACT|nr:hypothetical protein [Chitinophaga eiseniae]SKA04174.1 hypothetical protein SAMN04488128_102422 [Chitinophaga eiseniae]
MKKTILFFMLLLACAVSAMAQTLDEAVHKLDNAASVKDYEALEKTFTALSAQQPDSWLPWYYAAYCNAKIGFLYQDDGDKIEPYSVKGEEQIGRAQALLDSAKQRQELSEVLTVASMVNRTKVFINPMTYGRKYGMLSEKYLQQALQLQPENPRALFVRAWVKYYTPKMWGGDKPLAKELAEKSLGLLAKDKSGTAPHWGKVENEALLAKFR